MNNKTPKIGTSKNLLPEFKELADKYPSLSCHFSCTGEKLEFEVTYTQTALQSRNNCGVFLQQLQKQKLLTPLICNFLLNHSGVTANVLNTSSQVICIEQWQTQVDITVLFEGLEAVLNILDGRRSDLFFGVLMEFDTAKNTPYIQNIEMDSEQCLPKINQSIILLDDSSDPESLVHHDASLITLKESHLLELATYLEKILKPFVLHRNDYSVLGQSIRSTQIYFPAVTQHNEITNTFDLAITGPQDIAVSHTLAFACYQQSIRYNKMFCGSKAANWLLIRMTEHIIEQIRRNGQSAKIKVIGTNLSIYHELLAYLKLSEATSAVGTTREDVCILVLLPGAEIDLDALSSRCIIIDIFAILGVTDSVHPSPQK